jgi:hypothetical protein
MQENGTIPHPIVAPVSFKMVADVELSYQDKRYLGRLLVCTDTYEGPEYSLQQYEPTEYVGIEEEDSEEVPRALAKVPILKIASRSIDMHRGDFEVLQEIYVVHYSAFVSCRLFYLEGMTGIYALRGGSHQENMYLKRFSSNSHFRRMFNGEYLLGNDTYWQRILNVNRSQYLYLFRMAFLKNVQSNLRAMKGCGSFTFEMENSRVEYMQYLYDTARGSLASIDHEPEFHADKPGKTTRLLLDNAILPQQSLKDLVAIRIMDVESLIPAFGASWYYHPITEHNHVSGDFMSSKYSCIPHINSNVYIGLDINSMVMRCTVPAIAVYNQQSTLHGIHIFKNTLSDWREQLIGHDFHDPEDDLYYHVVDVEHNMNAFVDRKRRSLAYSCCVAWLACYNDYEIYEEPQLIEQSKTSSQVREEHCYPFLPEDVSLFLRVDISSVPTITINPPPKMLRSVVEMVDASGLDLDTYVFKAKDRRKMKVSEEHNFDHEAVAAKILSLFSFESVCDDISIFGMLRYALQELLLEAHCVVKDFYTRLTVALDHPQYNVEDLQKLFMNEEPFCCAMRTDESRNQLMSFKKSQKKKLLKFAVKRWLDIFVL